LKDWAEGNDLYLLIKKGGRSLAAQRLFISCDIVNAVEKYNCLKKIIKVNDII
jgi:hypothetical protein